MKHIINMFNRPYREKFIVRFVIVFTISLFLMNFVSFPGFLQGRIIITDSYSFLSVAFLLIFSVLGGLSATLYDYKVNMVSKFRKGEKLGILGGVLGVFTSACAVCYPFLLAILGIPAAFAILPFGGLEVQALSIVLLSLSAIFMVKDIEGLQKCRR